MTRGMTPAGSGGLVSSALAVMSAFLYRLAGNPNGAHPTCATMPFTDVATTARLVERKFELIEKHAAEVKRFRPGIG